MKIMATSCSHMTMAVATPQPAPPIAGMPNPPYTNRKLSGSFSARPPKDTAIDGTVHDSPSQR